MGEQHYCLRWNNHQPNFISVFKNLLDLEELVDVTLSVEGQCVKAHKIILSACSPYFKLLFSVTPSKHPTIILNDIKFSDLKTIIEFMYCGEISISEDQLPNILEVAELLQVRGLFDPNKKVEEATTKRKRKPKQETNGSERDEEFSNEVAQKSNEEDSGGNDSSQSEDGSFNGACQPDQPIPSAPTQMISPVTPPNPIKRRRSSKVQESENFHLALEAVRTGRLGFCKAAKLYGLNNRTLWLEYKKRGYPRTRSQPVGLKNKSSSLENTNNS